MLLFGWRKFTSPIVLLLVLVLYSAPVWAAGLRPSAASPEEHLVTGQCCPDTSDGDGDGNTTECKFNEDPNSPSHCLDANDRCRKCRDGGCFGASTKITMADGSLKSVEDISDGDMVLNPLTGKAVKVVNTTAGPEPIGLIRVELATEVSQAGAHPVTSLLGMITSPPADGEARAVEVTTAHPFITEDGLKQAQHLTLSDRVQDRNGVFRELTSVSKLAPKNGQYVWNFEIDTASTDPKDHAVLSNGIVSGDLVVQRQLDNK